LVLIESVLFSYLVNSMQNQARSTSWASAIDRSTCWPPCPREFLQN